MGDLFWNKRTEKVDENMGSFVSFPYFRPELWPLNCAKRSIFCNFVLTSARNLSLLKQFTYMDLKVLITIFQKIIWRIGVWATVRKIFLLRSAQNWKHAPFWQLNDHNSGRELENYTNDPILSSTLSALPVCNIYLWIWKYSQVFNRRSTRRPPLPPLINF